MDERLSRIRESERKSHTEIYSSEELYHTESWLRRPIKTAQEIAPYFSSYKTLRVLDLGCGIGRNSIFIADYFKNIDCTVDCVDLLEIAIEKLNKNAAQHHVRSSINGITRSIEGYEIAALSYDLIMAISALEHIDTEGSFLKKLHEIRDGLRENGIVCLVINSNVQELRLDTKEPADAQFEVNLPTETLQAYLNRIFHGWHIIKTSVKEQSYDIPREGYTSSLTTQVVTFVAQKTDL